MLQRLQSLFLLLCGAAFLLLFIVPFASSTTQAAPFFEDLSYTIQDHIILLVLAVGGGVLALANIFLFNNRTLQLRMGYILIILSIFVPLVAVWLIFSQHDLDNVNLGIDDQLGIFLPVASLIFAILANRFISKDEKLVQSMDRLR